MTAHAAMRALLMLGLGLCPAAALAASTPVRVGDHPGFGRIVFDLPAGATVETVAEGDRLLLVFKNAGQLSSPIGQPRNVTSLALEGTTATLVVTPGARVRRQRMGDRLVVDVFDPKEASPSKDAATPRKPSSPSADQTPLRRLAQPLQAAAPAPPSPAAHGDNPLVAEPAPTTPVQKAELDAAPAIPVAAPAAREPAHPTVLLPADATVGAAAFRRNGAALIVLDRRLPLVRPALAGAAVTLGQVSTTLELPLEAGQAVRLGRTQAGWTVDIVEQVPGSSPPTLSASSPAQTPGGTAFPQPRPGRVVTVLDPTSGATLLVGTSLAAGPDIVASPERRSPEYAVLPAWQGVAIEPLADQVDLRPIPAGFLLTGGADLPKAPADTAGRRFDLPDEPVPALLNRLRAQLATAAAAPPRARGPARRAVAEAMLALGMGVEAQAVLQHLMAEDPQSAADAQVRALAAAAAVLGWRLDEADALDDPSLAATPEAALWRGVRDRRRGNATAAAAALPGLVPLASTYPGPLKRLVWPDIAEATAEAGVPLPDGQATPFAAILALQRAGKLEEALAGWTALAASPDRLDATRASVRGTELALASGTLTTDQAADAIERQVFAWRGDGRELALRLRAAELRAAAGGWRVALDALRDTETLFPEQTAAIKLRKAAVFEGMLAAEGSGLSPLEVVLLASDYADCVPEGSAGAALATLLADKLVALDLPARAIPVLQGLVKRSVGGPARAEFGTRLAQLLQDGGDTAGAAAALQASAAPGLPPALDESRALLQARILAAQGDTATAATELKALGTAKADDLRATLLAASGDWRGSLVALNDLAARSSRSGGPLPEADQAIVMRQASAATRIPDPVALRALAAMVPRMTPPRRDLLQVLTQAPVMSANELPRAATELKLARQIPQ